MILLAIASVELNHCYAEAEAQNKEIDKTINLRSDNSISSGKTGIFELCGNAELRQLNMLITADCLVGKRREDGSYEYISATGKPAVLKQINEIKYDRLMVTANEITFFVPEQRFVIRENSKLEIENAANDSIKVTAEEIELDNKIETQRKISAKGTPLEIEIKKKGNTDLKATSKNLKFDTGTSAFELNSDVIANLELGQISAGEFKYNSENKESSFTRSSEEQIEIIQKKKDKQ